MIWDFRGPGAERTAEHHRIHLEEYARAKELDLGPFGVESFGESHALAFLVAGESKVGELREALKPHRGQVYTEQT